MNRRNLLITAGITVVLIYICFSYLLVSTPMPSARTPTPTATLTTQPATNTPSPTPISPSPTATFTSPLTASVTSRLPLTATTTPPSPTPLPTITSTPVPPSPTPPPTITSTPVPPSPTPLPTSTPAPALGARTTFKDITEILKNISTIGAIIVGGIWTYMLFVRKRERYPRAKLTHSITHRPLTEDKVLLHVTVTISNAGELLLEFDDGTIFIQQVLPLSPKIRDIIEKDKDPVSDGETEIGWPMPKGVKSRKLQRELGEFQIEPGDSQDVYCDFVLNADVQTVLVYSYFSNIIKGRKIGWNLKTIYDLQSREQKSDQQEGSH